MYESTILGGLLAPAPLGNGPGDAYLGFCIDQYLQPTRYGWIHIANSASNPFDVHIIDWAYETTGAPILAGAIPTPGSAMLASAAAFIAFRRCRKVSRSYANLRPTTLLGHDFTVDSHGSPL